MKSRQELLHALSAHQPFNEHEAAMRARLIEFVAAHESCYSRLLLEGHVTASAWVVDSGLSRTLLTHHAKLGLWLQPGGHCDGDPDVLGSALREVREEAGLTRLTPMLGGRLFDVDAHEIPSRGTEPAHIHYDVRFLIQADPGEPLRVSAESHDLAWVDLDRVAALNTDESVLRMVARTLALRPSSR